jgi:YidC/Oxa1 family membrane protein insertase
MWTWFKDLIFAWIQLFANISGDWGMAIILITVVIRLAMMPLTNRQYKSSYQMQKIQPKLQEIQEKYADDKERLNEEMMKVYADNKYSPLAGCLPILIQMPIFIALYQVLLERIPEGATFYGLIGNLSASPSNVWSFSLDGFLATLPYIVLVALFAVSTLIPMLMQDTQNNSMTKMMTVIMAIMMTWFAWVAPAGVSLYWDASAYIGLAMQATVRARLKSQDKKEEEILAEKPQPVQVNVVRRTKKARPHKKH